MTVERSGRDLRDEPTDAETLAGGAEGETAGDRSGHEGQRDGGAARGPRKVATLTPQVRDRIALQLRSMYDSVATQPVPDRFADLIARLDAGDREAS